MVNSRERRYKREAAAQQCFEPTRMENCMGRAASDINERVFRHVMCRTPQESLRGFVSRMDQRRRGIRDNTSHSVATASEGEG
jgi:hypothetical protein